MNPLVSIIVPCYNQAQFLPEALQSVWEQTYENWECIIVNDGSPDNTHEVAQEWLAKDKRFSYFKIKNGGVSKARNIGLSRSKGCYIQFLDADDTLESQKIDLQVSFLENERQVDIVYSSSRYFYANNSKELFAIHYTNIVPTIDLSKWDKNQKEILVLRNICTICASLYRKQIFEKIKFKDVVYEDWLFHIECALNNYVFHFEKFYNSTSFIRMTKQSQMIKHSQDNDKKTGFNTELIKLISVFNFKSKLSLQMNSIKKSNVNKKNKIIQSFLISLTPPIVLKLYNKITLK